jgi:hypothetical protein
MKILHKGEVYHINFISTFEPSLDLKAELAFDYVSGLMGNKFSAHVRAVAIDLVLKKRNGLDTVSHPISEIVKMAPNSKISQLRITEARLEKEIKATNPDKPTQYELIEKVSTKQSIFDKDNKLVGKSIAFGRLLKKINLGSEFETIAKATFDVEFRKKK